MLIAALATAWPNVTAAAPVDLRSDNGLIDVSGELLWFYDQVYTMQTDIGVIHVPASQVTCFGEACPTIPTPAAPIQIAAATPKAMAIAQSILTPPSASSSRSALFGRRPEQVTIIAEAGSAETNIHITDVSATATTTGTSTGTLQDWVTDTAPSQLLATKALSIVTSPDTGIDSLTLPQIAQVFAGEIVNWAELGGVDLDVTLMLADEGTRLHEDLQDIVMSPARKPITPVFMPHRSAAEVKMAVSLTPGSIGVLPADLATDMHTIGVTDACGITTRPTDFAIRAGAYPLMRSTLVVYPNDIDAPFLQTAFDQAAQALTTLPNVDKMDRMLGLMSDGISDPTENRAADLIETLINAKQLDVSFADGPLSETQGAWTRSHFVRLRDGILKGMFDGQEIVFIGFAKAAPTQSALAMSQAAADRILSAFTAFAPIAATRDRVALRSSGHGTLGPATCTITQDFAPRVEVWARPAP